MTRQAMVLAIEAAAEAFDRPLSDQESVGAHEAAGANALIDGIEEAIAMQLATAAAAWQAFEVVCREEMAVEPKKVIAASFGREFLALHERELDQVATAEADADAVARWRELFGERWRAAAR